MANRSRHVSNRHLAVFVVGLLVFMPGCGGSTKLEFYSNEPGNFRVLVAGKPASSSKGMASPAGEFTMNTIESVDGHQIRREADTALAEATRARYQDLSASFNSMKDLYANTNRPADKYAAAVQALRGKYLRLIESLQKDLKMEVPANLIALLKARASDGQAQTMVTQVVPQRVQSRLRSRSSLSQRGAGTAGSRPSAAQKLQEKMQNRRDSRNNRRGNN